jgi:hypothetical protein
MKKLATIILFIVFFLSYRKEVQAWSDWYRPVRFAGMFYDSPGNNWSNTVQMASPNSSAYATVDVQFGNPAPQIWYQSFGFDMDDSIGKKVTKIELEIVMRRRYNVTPSETVWAYIVSPDGDVITALNATNGVFYKSGLNTSFATQKFTWNDDAIPNDRVSKYLDSLDDYYFTVVIGVSKNSTSGSTNFVDMYDMRIRFEDTATWLSDMLPADVTKVDLAIDELQETLDSRAPFAYFNAVTGLDFTPVASQSLQLSLPVPYPSGLVIYPIIIPQRMTDILSTFRYISGIAIIGLVIVYLMRLSDRTF